MLVLLEVAQPREELGKEELVVGGLSSVKAASQRVMAPISGSLGWGCSQSVDEVAV